MANTVKTTISGNELWVKISGRFDYKLYKEFEAIYKSLNQSADVCVVDFKEATFLDSSALGMLLVLRDRIGRKVRLINMNEDIRSILEIANFQELFQLA